MSAYSNNEKIKIKITNDDILANYLEIANFDGYTYPLRKYYYDVCVKDATIEVYVNDGYAISGIFENVTFTTRTFLDSSTFRKMIFKNCIFDNVDCSRWIIFDNCQFINCKGSFRYARGVNWKKNCTFIDSSISIGKIDEYIYINSKRYNTYHKIENIVDIFNIDEKELKSKSSFLTLAEGIVHEGMFHLKNDVSYFNEWQEYELKVYTNNDGTYCIQRKERASAPVSTITFSGKKSAISGLNCILYNDRRALNYLIREGKFKPSIIINKWSQT